MDQCIYCKKVYHSHIDVLRSLCTDEMMPGLTFQPMASLDEILTKMSRMTYLKRRESHSLVTTVYLTYELARVTMTFESLSYVCCAPLFNISLAFLSWMPLIVLSLQVLIWSP